SILTQVAAAILADADGCRRHGGNGRRRILTRRRRLGGRGRWRFLDLGFAHAAGMRIIRQADEGRRFTFGAGSVLERDPTIGAHAFVHFQRP
ncbi:MAG: hypothetical protein KDI72_10425, partial [Xanthomonadales bacterium]|nr:hypothetical protein [Xanthomonadales bacterium]